LEMASFIAPLVLLAKESARRHPAKLFVGAVLLMLGGVLLRINSYLVGYETGDGWHYFPSIAEMLVTFGMFAIEVFGYIVITRRFPVLASEPAAEGAAH
ncbi:MAG TPA: Ni/Fe-hydrogenase cytochrome b subunit, partial [Azospira sp.]|nr:Ni/Fe-hydrogenase cytochrome b subunit [Azospira sp.]